MEEEGARSELVLVFRAYDFVVWCMLVLAGKCAGGGREGGREGGKGCVGWGVLVATLLI